MSIVLDQLLKRYEGHAVVNQVSLEVLDGEFFVLLGPSGSGKSTVLRMIAGLTEVDRGSVSLHGRDVTHLAPKKRGVGFVFQHYALFRHMSVADNIEFALKIRRVAAAERRRRRDELLELVGLTGLGGRMPSQLSGGQQQRVALARALAHQPAVLLLDEPFGALDAKIRTELRRTLRAIQRELRITSIFVTHDQEEAFELADRIGVMNFGRLLEVGPPEELYLRPQTEFVATFLGTANLMVGECTEEGVRLGPVQFPLKAEGAAGAVPRRVQVLFRPEDVAVKTEPEALGYPLLGEAVVEESGFSGSYERLLLRMPKLPGVRPISPPAPFGGESFFVEAKRSQHQSRRFPLAVGQAAWVGVRRLHALTHPGMSFLLLTDGSERARAALETGGEMARRAHARVTILAHDMEEAPARAHLQEAREKVGRGLVALDAYPSTDPPAEAVAIEAARQHYDLLVAAPPKDEQVEVAERLLGTADHHLLLVSGATAPPAHILVCVAVGEPGKQDVRFIARLGRHLSAEATVFTALPRDATEYSVRQAERFLTASVRTLSLYGVPARTLLRRGDPRAETAAEVKSGGHDLVVLGAPLVDTRGRMRLEGFVSHVLEAAGDRPVLIVQSHHVVA
jgi:sulfate transport system ATP-binding protein